MTNYIILAIALTASVIVCGVQTLRLIHFHERLANEQLACDLALKSLGYVRDMTPDFPTSNYVTNVLPIILRARTGRPPFSFKAGNLALCDQAAKPNPYRNPNVN